MDFVIYARKSAYIFFGISLFKKREKKKGKKKIGRVMKVGLLHTHASALFVARSFERGRKLEEGRGSRDQHMPAKRFWIMRLIFAHPCGSIDYDEQAKPYSTTSATRSMQMKGCVKMAIIYIRRCSTASLCWNIDGQPIREQQPRHDETKCE